MKMTASNLATLATNYQSKVSSGGANWLGGITGYTGTSPGVLAAAQSTKMVSNYSASMTEGGAGNLALKAVQTTQWQQGAQGAQSKYTGSAAAGSQKWLKKMQKNAPQYMAAKAAAAAVRASGGGATAAWSAAVKQLMMIKNPNTGGPT